MASWRPRLGRLQGGQVPAVWGKKSLPGGSRRNGREVIGGIEEATLVSMLQRVVVVEKTDVQKSFLFVYFFVHLFAY
jgi:hypothetical protein